MEYIQSLPLENKRNRCYTVNDVNNGPATTGKGANTQCCNDKATILLLTEQIQDEAAFIDFLYYCSGRLSKGDTVQAIWHDYQELVAKKYS